MKENLTKEENEKANVGRDKTPYEAALTRLDAMFEKLDAAIAQCYVTFASALRAEPTEPDCETDKTDQGGAWVVRHVRSWANCLESAIDRLHSLCDRSEL